MPGAKLMTYEEMKEQEPDAVRYVAPWGMRKAQQEVEDELRYIEEAKREQERLKKEAENKRKSEIRALDNLIKGPLPDDELNLPSPTQSAATQTVSAAASMLAALAYGPETASSSRKFQPPSPKSSAAKRRPNVNDHRTMQIVTTSDFAFDKDLDDAEEQESHVLLQSSQLKTDDLRGQKNQELIGDSYGSSVYSLSQWSHDSFVTCRTIVYQAKDQSNYYKQVPLTKAQVNELI